MRCLFLAFPREYQRAIHQYQQRREPRPGLAVIQAAKGHDVEPDIPDLRGPHAHVLRHLARGVVVDFLQGDRRHLVKIVARDPVLREVSLKSDGKRLQGREATFLGLRIKGGKLGDNILAEIVPAFPELQLAGIGHDHAELLDADVFPTRARQRCE